MENVWVQHLLRVVGLCFGTLGATAVLAADWSTVEDVLVKVGRIDPIMYSIPLVGYPFRQAKYLADMLESSDDLFNKKNPVTTDDDGFILLKKLALRVNDRKSLYDHPPLIGNIKSEEFVKMELARTVESSILIEDGMYTKLVDDGNNEMGWVRTDLLRTSVINYAKDVMSKAGASLFIGGFILQLIAELTSIPSYPSIEIPHVVVGVAVLFMILSIPGFCEQMDL